MTTRELKALSFKKRNGMGSKVINIYTFRDFTKSKHVLSKQNGYFHIHVWLYFQEKRTLSEQTQQYFSRGSYPAWGHKPLQHDAPLCTHAEIFTSRKLTSHTKPIQGSSSSSRFWRFRWTDESQAKQTAVGWSCSVLHQPHLEGQWTAANLTFHLSHQNVIGIKSQCRPDREKWWKLVPWLYDQSARWGILNRRSKKRYLSKDSFGQSHSLGPNYPSFNCFLTSS